MSVVFVDPVSVEGGMSDKTQPEIERSSLGIDGCVRAESEITSYRGQMR